MRNNRFYLFTLLFFLSLFGYLLFRIINPFITSIIWAMVMTIIFFPLYSFLLKYIKKEHIAATLTTLIVIFFILGPVTYLGTCCPLSFINRKDTEGIYTYWHRCPWNQHNRQYP